MKTLIPNRIFSQRNLPRLLLLATVALCAASASAQSGRHAAKAAPTPAPTTEPPPLKKPPAEKTGPSLLVGSDSTDVFLNVPPYYHDTVLQSCAHRLNDSSAKADVADRSMNRGEAVKKAKDEKEAYVVLLQLKYDNMNNSNNSIYDLIVEYVVFAPTTAKIVTTGRAYLGATQKGAVIPRTTGGTTAMYTEQLLKRAGEEAAERILHALHVGTLPPNLP
jgi:hypothetical protein